MASYILFVVLTCLSPTVLSGSRNWEVNLSHQHNHEQLDIPVDNAGYAVTDNATHSIQKRYLAMRPQDGPGLRKLWPDKTISYCYESQATKDILNDELEQAIMLWQPGLHRDVYKYHEVADPGEATCVGNSQRDHILVIRYNSDGNLATSVGLPSLDGGNPTYKGPTMMLSDKTNVGLLSVVANYAHEIGHAWGLYHEHQNLAFWGFPQNTGSAGTVFGEKWDCTALKDYGAASARVQAENPKDMELLCVFQGIAAKYGFSAADWLPVVKNTLAPSTIGNRAGYDKVDWDSIMMYPSGAGGRGDAAPPGGDTYDLRQPVLLRNDGAKMVPKLQPSLGDIAGIRRIYEDAAAPQGQPVLINDKSSKWYSKLKIDFRKKKGC